MPNLQSWQRLVAAQEGLATRQQLLGAGIDRWAISHRVRTGRWQVLAPTVVATTTGPLTAEQRLWLGVLHAGPGALIAGVHAAQAFGLRNWERDVVTLLFPYAQRTPPPLDRFAFVRTRRALGPLRAPGIRPPTCRLEPSLLLFASRERSERTASGILAAAVQQRLTSPQRLKRWLEELAPLARSPSLRRALEDFEGGAQSVAEVDIRRMCRRAGLAPPRRQVRRRDAAGRLRFTDCEWQLPGGRVLVLEVDGAFHMDVEHWEDDLARQRALVASARLVVRCTAREVRDTPQTVARDLVRLGVPLL